MWIETNDHVYNQPRACDPEAPAEARPKHCQHPGR